MVIFKYWILNVISYRIQENFIPDVDWRIGIERSVQARYNFPNTVVIISHDLYDQNIINELQMI